MSVSDTINESYSKLAAKLGDLEFRRRMLDEDIATIYSKLKELNAAQSVILQTENAEKTAALRALKASENKLSADKDQDAQKAENQTSSPA